MPSGAATMQMMRTAVAPAARSRSRPRHGAAARREHRIDHQHVARREIRRQLRVVLRRDRRHLVALQADVADARARDQLQHGVEHAESRPQHRHDDDVRADAASGRGTDRRLDGDVRRRQIARRLGGQQHADARRGAAEMLGRRALVAQRDERVVHQRMVDEVDGHGQHYTAWDEGATVADVRMR